MEAIPYELNGFTGTYKLWPVAPRRWAVEYTYPDGCPARWASDYLDATYNHAHYHIACMSGACVPWHDSRHAAALDCISMKETGTFAPSAEADKLHAWLNASSRQES